MFGVKIVVMSQVLPRSEGVIWVKRTTDLPRAVESPMEVLAFAELRAFGGWIRCQQWITSRYIIAEATHQESTTATIPSNRHG